MRVVNIRAGANDPRDEHHKALIDRSADTGALTVAFRDRLGECKVGLASYKG
jgi:hypothetical protein